jgi:hypothetical protein
MPWQHPKSVALAAATATNLGPANFTRYYPGDLTGAVTGTDALFG